MGRPDKPGDDELWGAEPLNAVYIMASRKYGTLYVGVTSDLLNRTAQHRESSMDGFTKQYGVKRLVCTKGTRVSKLPSIVRSG
jgi:predicted GIY-YIG superfamily endonuclease